MMPFLKRLKLVWLLVACIFYTAEAAAATAPLAFLPLQDLSQGRNGINFSLTRYLTERIEKNGTEVYNPDTVISFLANNRIRTTGQLESYYINLAREELGVSYILLGTVIQNSETPTLSLGVTLNLIRTYDARTVWSYVGAFSEGDFRHLLEIGEPKSIEALQVLLGNDIMKQWPGNKLIQEEQSTASIESMTLRPKSVIPGGEMYCSVHLRNLWAPGRAPSVFFKADDQIHSATAVSREANTYEATWVAGEKDGRYPVNLILEWPRYNRIETFQLGTYLVDGVKPLIELKLRGASLQEGELPVFSGNVTVVPRRLIRKPIDHWRISFRNSADLEVAARKSDGELPEVLTWNGRNFIGGQEIEGEYQVVFEVWDKTGNTASATSRFELNHKLPSLIMTAEKEGQAVTVNLKSGGKVPLAFWRLEMWSKEGKLLKTAEGRDLPPQIEVELPTAAEDQEIEGTLVLEDVLGNKVRKNFDNLLHPPEPEKNEIIEVKPTTKAWVDEF